LSRRACALALAATLAVAGAHATTVNTGKPAASQPAARAYATRDQLRECLDIEAALKARSHVLEANRETHEHKIDQLAAENAKLLEVQAQLDHDSDVAVNAFNLLVTEHNVHVKQINRDAVDAQPLADAYNADMLAYNRQCSPLMYRVDDMDAVLKERKKAAAQGAAASVP
jgi:hypothetical protein